MIYLVQVGLYTKMQHNNKNNAKYLSVVVMASTEGSKIGT